MKVIGASLGRMSRTLLVSTGAVVSTIVKVAVQLAELPWMSVAVKVTVVLPVAPHPSESPLKSFPDLAIAQLSVAENEFNQAFNAAGFLWPSHSTTKSGGHFRTGSSLSSTVTVNVHVAVSPKRSVAVAVTAVVPVRKNDPGAFE